MNINNTQNHKKKKRNIKDQERIKIKILIIDFQNNIRFQLLLA